MRTIELNSMGRDKYDHSDFNPLIGVSDGHLMTTAKPSLVGTFASGSGELPSIVAKSFRLTNGGASDVSVSQRSMIFSRYFDDQTAGVFNDSPSIKMAMEQEDTPLGTSQVLEITHSDDTAIYSTVPVIPSSPTLTYRIYFKIKSISADQYPLALYSNKTDIDIQHPAASIVVKSDLSIAVRVGLNEFTPSSSASVSLNNWNRATISISGGTDFQVQVEEYTAGAYTALVSSSETYSSIGVGLLDECFNKTEHTIAISSNGPGVQQVDALEVYRPSPNAETLLAGSTKEYFCNRSLDELMVDGPVTGYYRS